MDSSSQEARLLLTSRLHALERKAASAPPRDDPAAAERREVVEIEAALARIDEGSYGTCERCGGAIGRQRLRALPEIRYCTSCRR